MRVDIKTCFGDYAAFLARDGVYRLFFPNCLDAAQDFADTVDKNRLFEGAEAMAEKLEREVALYHRGDLWEFTVPVSEEAFDSSVFRRRVWLAMQKIPYAATCSYGDIAKAAGSTSGRAIGGACADNPVPLLIPCHRVIASNGALGGFRGGKTLKKQLLELEKNAAAGIAMPLAER